jgi:hypothetical protein
MGARVVRVDWVRRVEGWVSFRLLLLLGRLRRCVVERVVKGERMGRRMVRIVRPGEMGRERVDMVMCS